MFSRLLKRRVPFFRCLKVAAAAWVLVLFALGSEVPFAFEKTVPVTDTTLRLRVVANSDTAQDQEVKLAVRDAILSVCPALFQEAQSLESACASAQENGALLHMTALNTVFSHGKHYPVKVFLCKEYCPVRRYGELVFPAGMYNTLHIDLGAAKGKNWWCVLFPPLCLEPATGDVYASKDIFLRYGFSAEQFDKLCASKEKPKMRLAIVDFFKSLTS